MSGVGSTVPEQSGFWEKVAILLLVKKNQFLEKGES